jgi:hypothetical protein
VGSGMEAMGRRRRRRRKVSSGGERREGKGRGAHPLSFPLLPATSLAFNFRCTPLHSFTETHSLARMPWGLVVLLRERQRVRFGGFQVSDS